MTRMRRDRGRPLKERSNEPSPSRRSQGGGEEVPAFTRKTGLYGGAGIAIAVLGFYLLAQGSTALAPVLLGVAFFVLFPLALVK